MSSPASQELEVLCPYVYEGLPRCAGACLFSCVGALEVSLAVGSGVGLACAHPSAFAADWSVRYGKPLRSPKRGGEGLLFHAFFSAV